MINPAILQLMAAIAHADGLQERLGPDGRSVSFRRRHRFVSAIGWMQFRYSNRNRSLIATYGLFSPRPTQFTPYSASVHLEAVAGGDDEFEESHGWRGFLC